MQIIDGPFLTNDGIGWLVDESGTLRMCDSLHEMTPVTPSRHRRRSATTALCDDTPVDRPWPVAPEIAGSIMGAVGLAVMAAALFPWVLR